MEENVEEIYKKYKDNLGGEGFWVQSPQNPFTLVDKTNIELSYCNYKASERLMQAIKKFDKSSTILAKRMLGITILMAILVIIQIVIMLTQNTP